MIKFAWLQVALEYKGGDMKTVHANMNISNAEFNALAECLYSALEKHNVPYSMQNKLIAMLAPMPSAKVPTTVALNPGCCRSIRNAYRKSCATDVIISPRGLRERCNSLIGDRD